MKMLKWLKSLFKRRTKELPHNLNHPEYCERVEEAFECQGVTYYRMKHEFHLPAGRYKFLDAALMEVDMRMTLPMLVAYLDKIEAALNGKGGTIKLSDISVIVHNMRTHANLGFHPETVRRLAAIIYFDDTEDLRDYDHEYGTKKIEAWNSDGKLSFFLTRPIVELLNLQDTSVESLERFIRLQEEIIKELTSDPQTPSLENS